MEKTAYLVLENGKTFKGNLIGNIADVTGEVVFSTAMNGYVETLTDPNFYGQIVVQTFPLIGNYGVMFSDMESGDVKVSAYIAKSVCEVPSNFRSEGDLDTFFKEKNVTCLCGIDTRALTKELRECGSMNGIITSEPDSVDMEKLKAYKVEKAVENSSCGEGYVEGEGDKNVVILDLGVKNSIKEKLISRGGCSVKVMPYSTKAEDIIKMSPDGIVISNGGGNPADNKEVIAEVKKLMESGIPMLGIGLGHQIMALSCGFECEKLKYGHRGANIPVKSTENGRVYITSQNHGYAVKANSVDKDKAEILFYNINDKSCEGLKYKNSPAFSLQFYPDGAGGLCDTTYLLDKFFSMMEGR